MALNKGNADIIYNTAQVLVSLEQKLGDEGENEASKPKRRQVLEEAVQLFIQCLSIQEHEFASSLEEDGGVSLEEPALGQDHDEAMEIETPAKDDQNESEQWATIVEPVTAFALLETATAHMEALADLVLISGPYGLGQFDIQLQLFESFVQSKVVKFLEVIEQSPEPPATASSHHGLSLSLMSSSSSAHPESQTPRQTAMSDATIAVASAYCVLAEAKYRSNSSSTSDYATDILLCFKEETFNSRNIPYCRIDPAISLAQVAEIVDAAATIREVAGRGASADEPSPSTSRWKLLSRAQDLLAAVASTAPQKAKLYLTRGDVELQRFWLSLEVQQNAAQTLLRNAGVYYRGAAAHARQAQSVSANMDTESLILEAEVKERAVMLLSALGASDSDSSQQAVSNESLVRKDYSNGPSRAKLEDVAREIVKDFLVEAEWADQIYPLLVN